jgi:hypothetical protein
MHNSQHVLSIDGLAQTWLQKLFSSEGQMSSLLHEDYSNSIPGSITFQDKSILQVRKHQDKSYARSLSQGVEGLLSYWIPIERICFKESSEWCCNFSIIMNKPTIIYC